MVTESVSQLMNESRGCLLNSPGYTGSVNHKELEETTLECNSCDNTCTKKYTPRMHKGVKHKTKLINCDKCDYS